MKKTRNSFFAESSYQAYNPNPNYNPNMNMQMQQAPYQTASNYYYQGPFPDPNALPNNYNTLNSGNDIESRLAKIERQLNRIDYRLTKLENANNIVTSDDFDTNSSNMYML